MSGLSLTFLLAAGGLTLIVLAVLTGPLLRSRPPAPASRDAFALRVHRDQLAEIDRDLQRGVLAPAEAAAARLEVQRRMLAAAAAIEATAETPPAAPAETPVVATPLPSSPPPSARVAAPRRPLPAVVLAAAVSAAAVALYAHLGNPQLADQPLAQRRAQELAAAGGTATTETPAASDAEARVLEEGAERLARRLESAPDDMQGWFMLGRAYLALGRNAEAVVAFRRARALMPGDADVEGALAEALIASASGRITAEARATLERVLQADPTSPQARFLLALDRAQQGDLRGAVQGWTDLIALSPAGAPWLPMVREHMQRAADALGIDARSVEPTAAAQALAAGTGSDGSAADASPAPGPSTAEVEAAAAMSEGERAEMIRGMVDRLAARLQQEPDDRDGWRRLAQAYRVLGEDDKARAAEARAEALVPR